MTGRVEEKVDAEAIDARHDSGTRVRRRKKYSSVLSDTEYAVKCRECLGKRGELSVKLLQSATASDPDMVWHTGLFECDEVVLSELCASFSHFFQSRPLSSPSLLRHSLLVFTFPRLPGYGICFLYYFTYRSRRYYHSKNSGAASNQCVATDLLLFHATAASPSPGLHP